MLYVDTCALCLRHPLELRRSHILPKYAYRRARSDETVNPNPVHFRRGAVTYQTSDQVRTEMLCDECEQRFSLHERHASYNYNVVHEKVLPASEQLPNGWRLLDPVPGVLDTDRLRYFAVSVIWRAHHYYRSQDPRRDNAVALGRFEPAIRRFLLGEGPFEGAFTMAVYEDVPGKGCSIGRMTSFPVGGRCPDGVWRHSFFLGGVDYCLMPGKSPFPNFMMMGAPTHFLKHPFGFIANAERAKDLERGLRLKTQSR